MVQLFAWLRLFKSIGKDFLVYFGWISVSLYQKKTRVISSTPDNRFLPMLILIGSFSLLAVSTRCRRTSITPSLCLLVSMVSQSACAAGDLVGKTIMQVIWFCWESQIKKEKEGMHSFFSDVPLSLRAIEPREGKHGTTTRTWLSARLSDRGPAGLEAATPLWDHSQEKAEVSERKIRNVPSTPPTAGCSPYISSKRPADNISAPSKFHYRQRCETHWSTSLRRDWGQGMCARLLPSAPSQ